MVSIFPVREACLQPHHPAPTYSAYPFTQVPQWPHQSWLWILQSLPISFKRKHHLYGGLCSLCERSFILSHLISLFLLPSHIDLSTKHNKHRLPQKLWIFNFLCVGSLGFPGTSKLTFFMSLITYYLFIKALPICLLEISISTFAPPGCYFILFLNNVY